MANLPSQHPALSIHLSDLALTPLITSSSSPSHLDSLTSLTSTALSAQTAARRAHLGRPQRIMVEYPDAGPVVLQTYLDPADANAAALHKDSAPHPDHARADAPPGPDAPAPRPDDAAPVLVGLVVAASSDHAREARRAAARLESLGRDFQRQWAVHGALNQTPDPGPE